MKGTIIVASLLFVAAAFAACNAASGGDLASGGSKYRIDMSSDAKQWEESAGEELAHYLPLLAKDGQVTVEGMDGVVFHVGDTAFAKEHGLASSRFRDEEWGIRSFGRDVVLNGGGSRGCLYAVYHFLEDFCGVRWWNDDEEDVPDAKPLAFPQLKKRGRPHFFYRDIYRAKTSSPRFAARCRVNGNGVSFIPPELGGGEVFGPPKHCHTWNSHLPFAKYGREHPEWYSMRGGRRIGGDSLKGGSGQVGQLCLTCPGLPEVLAARIEESIAKGEAEARAKGLRPPRLYDMSMNDNKCYCECEACQAEIKKYGMSGYQLRFENKVAEILGAKHPDLLFSVFAYHESEEIPKVPYIKAASNIVVKLCNTRQNMTAGIFDKSNKFMHDQVKNWSGYAPNLFVWDYAITYLGLTMGYPFPSEWHIVDKIRYYADHGTNGMLIEHEHPDKADMYELKYYLERRALEDPAVDGAALIDEFYPRYYGAAGAKVRAAREHLARICRERGGHLQWSPNFSEFSFFRVEDADRMVGLFDEAEALVKGDEKRLSRVRRSREGTDRIAAALHKASLMHPPEPGVSDVPFFDFPVRKDDGSWRLYNRSLKGFDYAPDPDSPLGLCVNVPAADTPNNYYKLPFMFGFYSVARKKTFRKQVFEQPHPGNGYAWYDADDVKIPDESFYMYITRSWAVLMNATSPLMCGNTYKVRVRVKFEGPLFGKPGGENRLRIDRVVFIPKGARK